VPAAVRHDSLAALGDHLRRSRAAGVPFEVAWRECQPARGDEAVRWTRDRRARREWTTALAATQEGWRRAYEGQPATVGEAAVRLLADALADEGSLAAAA
jgi:hypothetical protein